jgi:hypothetical protein
MNPIVTVITPERSTTPAQEIETSQILPQSLAQALIEALGAQHAALPTGPNMPHVVTPDAPHVVMPIASNNAETGPIAPVLLDFDN